MMSKIKSGKIARIKLVGGFILAAALIAVFSLENKVIANVNTSTGTVAQQAEDTISAESDVRMSPNSTITYKVDNDVRAEQLTQASVDGTEKGVKQVNVIAYAPQKLDFNAYQKKPAADTLDIIIDGKTLKVSGDKETLRKFNTILTNNARYNGVRNAETGKIELTEVSNVSKAPKTAKSQDMIDGDPVFLIVEEMPEFPGGEPALRNFIAAEVKYPVEAQQAKIQGKVYVNFVVDKNGKVRDAKIARGVAPSLDAEALRVVSALPDWTPGKQRGKSVAVSYTVPINFALQ